MALRKILEFPDPRLRTIAKPVETFDDSIRTLIDDMFETMYEAPGIGLAATQINIHKRLIVIDVTEDQSQPLVFINPEVQVIDEELGEYDEGCLSVPGFFETVQRPRQVLRAHELHVFDGHAGKGSHLPFGGCLLRGVFVRVGAQAVEVVESHTRLNAAERADTRRRPLVFKRL